MESMIWRQVKSDGGGGVERLREPGKEFPTTSDSTENMILQFLHSPTVWTLHLPREISLQQSPTAPSDVHLRGRQEEHQKGYNTAR